MKRRRVIVIAAAIASPLLITGLLVLVFNRGQHRKQSLPARPAVAKSFNTDGLPLVRTDRCPSGADLLPASVTGDNVLPDLTLECIGEIGSTDSVSLRRLGGVPTVVNLWATWCSPCRAEMPDLQAVYAAAGGRVRFLGVNTRDYAGGARETINLTGIRYPSLADPDEQVRKDVGALGMPVTLFVSPAGKIVHRKLGQYADQKLLKDDIAEYLGVRL